MTSVNQLPDVEEYFFYEDVYDLEAYARAAICRCFRSNKELYRGKMRPTASYITCAGSPEDLAYHVASKMNSIVSEEDMMKIVDEPRVNKYVQQLADNINIALVLRVVRQMHDDGTMWTDNEAGTWNVKQSALDELRYARLRGSFKFDKRNYHGRNREQCKSRGIPAGSVSFASSHMVG